MQSEAGQETYFIPTKERGRKKRTSASKYKDVRKKIIGKKFVVSKNSRTFALPKMISGRATM